MPVPELDEDMPKWGWAKSLMYEKVLADERLGGRIKVIQLDFYASNMTCGSCKSNEYVWLSVPPHDYMSGVLATCSKCRMTWGPLAERPYASNRIESDITAEQAIEICLRTKQPIPRMLKAAYQQSQVEKARAKAGKRARPQRVGT